MTDYLQELQPPEWRNLVINPRGDNAPGATWLASNGTVFAADGEILYEVTTQSSLGYYFAPMGPRDGTVHYGGFRIPSGRQVSMFVSVYSEDPVWVQAQASWQNMLWSPQGSPSGLQETSSSVASDPVQLGSGWVVLVVNVAAEDVPEGPTHWRPLITIFADDPRVNPEAPAAGTLIRAVEAFVPDSGATLAGTEYGDGNTPGWEWEGEPNYSSSRTEDPAEQDPVWDAPAEEGLEEVYDDTQTADEVDVVPATQESVPPAPYIPDADDELVVVDPEAPGGVRALSAGGTTFRRAAVTNPRGPVTLAEDQIAWRPEHRHLALKGDVQLGSLVMNHMDEYGVVWVVSDIEGWWTTPEPDVPDVPRGWFDGSYETRGRYGARTFTVTGSFVPRARGDVSLARDRLIRAANLCHRGDWFMTHEDPSPARADTKGAKAWLAGQPLIATTGANGKTDFSIALRAPDPIKYGIRQGVPPGYETMRLITSNSVMPEREYPRKYPWAYPEAVFGNAVGIVENRGNAVVYPVLRMNGPTNGAVSVYNTDTGQRFRIVRKLYPGEQLVVDCATRQVTLNGEGNYRFYLDVDVDWLMLQPGPNKLYFAEEVLGGIRTELEVQWRSGWIG